MGTESSNPCTLQSGYWLVGIVDWPDRAGLPGVAHESLCFEHLERTCTPAGRPRRKSLALPRMLSTREDQMPSILNEALEWLDRAEQAREVAGQLTDPSARKA